MREVARAPLTFGQLSTWRSIADLPADRATSAHLQRAWALPATTTVAAVREALDLLELRHESLRTGYLRHGLHGVEQVVWEASGVSAEVVELVDDDDRGPVGVASDLASTPLALDQERPLSARIVVRHGRPTHLALSLHHLAADGFALDLLRDELLQLLGGVAPAEPAPTCRALAQQQRNEKAWLIRAEAAVAHWHRTLEQAGAATPLPDPAGAVHWSRLRSRPALTAALAMAETTGTSVQSVVFAAYCKALAARTGKEHVLVGVIAGNRNDPTSRSLLSTLNQLVPILVQVPAGCDFAELARRVHRSTLMAYRHGCFDVDALEELTATCGYDGVGAGFQWFFNFMPGSVSDPPEDGDSWSVETTTQGRDNGFPFYLKGGDGAQLDVTLRERGNDPAATEDFLVLLQDVLIHG